MPAKYVKIIVIAALSAISLALVIWIIWSNSALELNRYSIASARLPKAFDGYKIAQVSDLHNAQMGRGNADLLQMLRDAQPDMIAITGDLVDSRKPDMDIALDFVREAVKIAPCYYVTGNHEARLDWYPALKEAMEAAGVIVLADRAVTISRGEDTITLLGVNDPAFFDGYDAEAAQLLMAGKLAQLCADQNGFVILLAHRPHLFDSYVMADVDVVLSGHAHGGQFRLPFVGGVYVPSQGFFPKYDAGLFTQGNTNMIVSRGIGNSVFPFRVNNPPEVVLIELHSP